MANESAEQTHVWYCINNHTAEGYPPFTPCGCPPADAVVIRPLEDTAQVTLSYIEAALGMFLASTLSNALDDGQQEMLNEAVRRIEQVAGEL